MFSSGIEMHYAFTRNPHYYTKIFIIPSIIFVVLAYITFWISKDNPAARVLFSITNILNAISSLIQANIVVPKAPEYIWLTNFLLWNFIFTLIPVIEYAILNSADVSYNKRKRNIQILYEELVALA